MRFVPRLQSLLLPLLAASVIFLPAALAQAQQPAAADMIKRIAPLLDGQTVVVAHVRLDKVDVGQLVQLVGKIADLPAGETAKAEMAGKLALTVLVNAGAREAFVIASLDNFPFDLACVAIPVASEEEGKKIAVALKLGLKLRDTQEKVGNNEMMIQIGKDFVLIASKNTLKRLRTLQPSLPPHLEQALAAFPKADVRLAVLLPDSLRRSLGELMPQLPRELGGGKTAPLLDGFHYFAVGISLSPKLATEAALRTDDPKTATALRTLLADLMGLWVKEIAQDMSDVKMLPHLAWVKDMLTPRAEKDVLTWKMTEEEWIKALQPLAARIKDSKESAQSMNDLRQIALAFHNYHAVHKHFPTGIRDKQGKLLLSWRVQILPYVEGQRLYEQFKLDESWDSPHNINLVQQMPFVYRLPNSKASLAKEGKTAFLVPAGKGLFFDSAVPERKLQDITDGTSNTIMVLEVDDDKAAIWTKPDDLNVDPKQPMNGLGANPAGKIRAAFADGSVRVFNRKMAPAELYKLLTIAAGDVVNLP